MTIIPELIGYFAATLTTVSFIPQAILTLKTRNTDSLSLSMYSVFTLGVFFWLIYGLYLSNNAIIIANGVTLIPAVLILYVKLRNILTEKKKRGKRRISSGRYSG